jgi:transglutaminase-like putative cysteine protease
MRSIEPGISRFRVWSFGPSRNDDPETNAMRLRIQHITNYRYEPAATGVIQILRLTPGSHDGQYVAEWQIDVSTDSRLDMHEDAFGNVTHVMTHGAIEDLTITVGGLIETHDTGGVLRGTDERFPPSLFLRPTALTAVNPAMENFARELRVESEGDALGFLHALMTQVNEHMTFDEDPTNTGTSAIEAFALKRGVCQDYAHIFIACARSGGVPARFVAGHFLRSDGMVNQQAGHAWAEAHVPSLGWIGFDPANCICTTEAHARVAIGLDYLGAAPVRGTRYGGGNETLTVSVKVDQAGRPGQSQWQSQS